MSDDDQRNRRLAQNLFSILSQFLASNTQESDQDDDEEVSNMTTQGDDNRGALEDAATSSSPQPHSQSRSGSSQKLLHHPFHIEQLQIAGSSPDRFNHSLFHLLFYRTIGCNNIQFSLPRVPSAHSLTQVTNLSNNGNNTNNLAPTQNLKNVHDISCDLSSEPPSSLSDESAENKSHKLPPFRTRLSPFGERAKHNIMGRFLPFKQTAVLAEHDDHVFCGLFSKDGSLYLSACQDRRIRLYMTSRWRPMKEIIARDVGWSIISVDYSPNKEWLIYSSWSDYVHICNTSGEHEVHEALDFRPQTRQFCLFSIAFSPDSRSILGGSSDRCLYFYDLDRRERTHRIRAHANDVNAVAFTDNTSQILCSGSDDSLIKIWDRRTLEKGHVGVLSGHTAGITFIDSKGDGRYIISNGKDQCIKLWDLRKMKSEGTPLEEFFDYRFGLGVRVGRLPPSTKDDDSSLMTYRGHQVIQTLIRCRFSPLESTGQQYIYSGSFDGAVYIYDVLTGELKLRLRGHHATVRDVHWHPYEPLLLSTSWDGSVKIWQWSDDEPPKTPNIPKDTDSNRSRWRYFAFSSYED
jgi:WD40 repeat protein